MADPFIIARHFVWLADQDEDPAPLTQLHIHELLYYAQSGHLAIFGCPLFDGEFEAWLLGSVLTRVRPKLQPFGRDAIPFDQGAEAAELPVSVREFILATWQNLRDYSAVALSEKTHRETPWLEARAGLKPGEHGSNRIHHSAMAAAFVVEHNLTDDRIRAVRASYESFDKIGRTYFTLDDCGHRSPVAM